MDSSVTQSDPLAGLSSEARSFANASLSAHSIRAYAAQWGSWKIWAADRSLSALPAEPHHVANWLAERATGPLAIPTVGASLATLRTALSAIRAAHAAAGLRFDTGHPLIARVMAGIRRQTTLLPRQAAPLRGDLLSAIIATLGTSPRDCRDAALLALGYSLALRRSELVGLDLKCCGAGSGVLELKRDRIRVRLAQRKASCSPGELVMAGSSNALAIDLVRRWCDAANVQPDRPVFRRLHRGGRVGAAALDAQSVSAIVKNRVAKFLVRQGWPQSEINRAVQAFSGHSLRVGYAVTAAEAGADVLALQAALGHGGPAMTSRYAAAARQVRTSPLRLQGVALTQCDGRRRLRDFGVEP
jgi:site-specific recombinase XerD